MSKCPRCQGTGSIDEQGTLIGLAPFQDRPSAVDDDGWTLPEEDRTKLQEVPVFKIPKGIKDLPRIPSPKPTPSERPTAIVNAQELLSRARSNASIHEPSWVNGKWVLLLLFSVILGLAAGVWFYPWIMYFMHQVMPRWRSW